jgi:hypothetical protein
MPNIRDRPARSFPLFLAALLAAIPASGCGDASGVGRTVPVTGKVTFNDTPWTAKTTILMFKPDAAEGNSSPFEPTGTVDANGSYRLTTNGKNGAPPGWYKVVITAREEAAPEHPKAPKQQQRVSKSLLPAKYGKAETSGLSIEVVENPTPGAYDLKLNE